MFDRCSEVVCGTCSPVAQCIVALCLNKVYIFNSILGKITVDDILK